MLTQKSDLQLLFETCNALGLLQVNVPHARVNGETSYVTIRENMPHHEYNKGERGKS